MKAAKGFVRAASGCGMLGPAGEGAGYVPFLCVLYNFFYCFRII